MNHLKKYQFRSALDFTRTPVGSGRPLAICLEKIAHQQQLLQSVRQALPIHMAEHALHCVLSDARLLIYTNSAVWASQIRFYQEDILNKLQAAAQLKISRIQVKVMQEFVELRSNRPTRLPSPSTAYAMLKQIDENSQDELDLAMGNLAHALLKRLNRKS